MNSGVFWALSTLAARLPRVEVGPTRIAYPRCGTCSHFRREGKESGVCTRAEDVFGGFSGHEVWERYGCLCHSVFAEELESEEKVV